MERGTFVYRDGGMVPKHLAPPPFGRGPRSGLPAPAVRSDTIDALRGMHDGRLYDSKASLRASYKAHGVREVGTEVDAHLRDASATPAKPPAKSDLIQAYRKVREGYKPPPPSARNDPDLD